MIFTAIQFTILFWSQQNHHHNYDYDNDNLPLTTKFDYDYHNNNITTDITDDKTETRPSNPAKTTTTTTIMIPPQEVDGKQQRPDHSLLVVWNQLSKAWTDMNGTSIQLNDGNLLKDTDPYLSKLQQQATTNDTNHCSPTSSLQLNIIKTTTTTMNTSNTTINKNSSRSSSSWILKSFDMNGNIKSIGGDEFYITYSETTTKSSSKRRSNNNPQAVAYSIDQDDGTYLLEFVSPPKLNDVSSSVVDDGVIDVINNTTTSNGNSKPTAHDGGYLTIHFQYTCGIGQLPYGTKQLWRTGGALMISYEDIAVPKLTRHDDESDNIRSFVIPNKYKKIDLSRYTKIIMYGDSNLQYLSLSAAAGNGDGENENKYYLNNLNFVSRSDASLSKQTLRRRFLPKITWFVNDTISRRDQNQNEGNNNKYALIIGSLCWDIVFGKKVGPQFKHHLVAMKQLLEKLQQRFPTVDIYWHSGYALHIHVASQDTNWENHREPLKYMSYSRSFDLYKKQLAICRELNITVLDYMDATYLLANHYQYGDARHAEPYISKLLLSWYYPSYKKLMSSDG